MILFDLNLCSFFFFDFFLVTVLLASFHESSYSGGVRPFGQVSSIREFGLVFLLTEDEISFAVSHFCSINFSFENYLLPTTHYFISNFNYLPYRCNCVLYTTECPLSMKPNEAITVPFHIFSIPSLFTPFRNLFINVWEVVMTKGKREELNLCLSYSEKQNALQSLYWQSVPGTFSVFQKLFNFSYVSSFVVGRIKIIVPFPNHHYWKKYIWQHCYKIKS